MMFSNRRQQTKPTLQIGGVDVAWVDKQYLGMLIDNKINWNKYILETLKKATYTLARCRMLLGRHWGITPKVMNWLYTAVVRPIVTYGSLVWANKLEEKTLVKNLSKPA